MREIALPFKTISFSGIINRNELRLIRRMDIFFKTYSAEMLTEDEIRDIFALALNFLPARYVQSTTIVLGDPVSDDEIDKALVSAYDNIIAHPKN